MSVSGSEGAVRLRFIPRILLVPRGLWQLVFEGDGRRANLLVNAINPLRTEYRGGEHCDVTGASGALHMKIDCCSGLELGNQQPAGAFRCEWRYPYSKIASLARLCNLQLTTRLEGARENNR